VIPEKQENLMEARARRMALRALGFPFGLEVWLADVAE
jgi:hypothetical protein